MVKLTENDKLVFFSLVKWPNLNDTELSKNINIKRSTITAIRNKLEKNNFYTTINVPNLERIGCELLTVRYGSFNPLATYEMREKYSSTHKFPDVFFKRSADKQRFALSAAANFTEVKKYIDYSNRVYGEQGFLTSEGIVHVFFPFKVSKIFRFFDYAPLLRQHFNLKTGVERIEFDTDFIEHEKIELSENEKLVFYALVKYPRLNDNELASKVSMSRQYVSSARKKFEASGLIKTIHIPDLDMLGFQLLVLTHVMVNPTSAIGSRRHGIEKILSQASHIFYISGNLEFVLISAFTDYPEYNSVHEDIINYYKEHDLLLKDPVSRILINKDIKLAIDGRFAPLVKAVFDIKQEP
jgi:DNA-binding MarR family transcriptional regulator